MLGGVAKAFGGGRVQGNKPGTVPPPQGAMGAIGSKLQGLGPAMQQMQGQPAIAGQPVAPPPQAQQAMFRPNLMGLGGGVPQQQMPPPQMQQQMPQQPLPQQFGQQLAAQQAPPMQGRNAAMMPQRSGRFF